MMLIDANIFLELMLDHPRAGDCERFLATVEDGRNASVVTDLTLDTILIVMENKGRDASDLATFLTSMARHKRLSLYWLSLLDRLSATQHMEKLGLDFEDSAAYEACMRTSSDRIVSYDRHFDGLPGLSRVEPAELL